MPLGSVLVHEAVVLRERSAEDAEYVEGEPAETKPVRGPNFDCLLIFVRGGDEQNVPRGRRVIARPVILFEPFDQVGADLALDASDQVEISASEILGPDPVVFQLEGAPTPMAKPGFMVGFEAPLRRVDD